MNRTWFYSLQRVPVCSLSVKAGGRFKIKPFRGVPVKTVTNHESAPKVDSLDLAVILLEDVLMSWPAPKVKSKSLFRSYYKVDDEVLPA